MTEQEAIARLRGPKKQMNTIRIAPGHWQTAVIVGEQDLRILLDRVERLTEALEEAIQELEDERGHYYMGRPTGASAFIDAVVAPLREALEGKQ